jgi:ketosteroid isomerase-like protein
MRRLLLLSIVICTVASGRAQSGDEAAIRAVMTAQTAAWNRGDVAAFMQGYDNSPATTFVGASSVHKGYEPILQRYLKDYSTAAQMGTLSFSNIDVRLLPCLSGPVEYAVVTGNFHLERRQKSVGTKDDGLFSLVWRKGPHGWKIVLDHTS